jgi:hypothetical protein
MNNHTIRLVSIGTFQSNELLTRVLRQTFHVTHDNDTQVDDGCNSRLMTIYLNGRPIDDAKLWTELVDTVKQRVAADYESQLQHWQGVADMWHTQYLELMDDIGALAAKLEAQCD